MHKNIIYKIGTLIYHLRWPILGLWFAIIICCIPLLPNIISPFKTTGFVDEHSESAEAENYLSKNLKYNNNNFIILYTSKNLLATNPKFTNKIKESLEKLSNFPLEHQIVYPSDNKEQISKDAHTAYVSVMIKSQTRISDILLEQFKSSIKTPKNMKVQIGGQQFFEQTLTEQTRNDLNKADLVATPVSIITLIIVFGSIIAALIPIALGGGCAIMILSSLYFLGHAFTLSIFTINIALLLGLCLCLDYSLFIICRFRDELNSGKNIIEAVSITQATAGKAIFFSGLAVFVSLSALLLFPINILFSVAIGGLTAVFVAVFSALVFLPALLSILNTKINLLPIRLFKNSDSPNRIWHWIAEKVVNRPLFFFIFILIILLSLGYPFLNTKLGISDFHIFPPHSTSRQFFDNYSDKFSESDLRPIKILVLSNKSKITSKSMIDNLYDLTTKLKENNLITKVDSIVTTKPQLTKEEYFKLYNLPKSKMDDSVKKLLKTTTGKHFTIINIVSKYPSNSNKTKTLINNLNELKLKKGMSIILTGDVINDYDIKKVIAKTLPSTILWIMVFTYLILLILLRSLFLPFKAILMNLLSLSACYGAMVIVFQDGYLHQFLNFEPQGMLDISLMVIIFCAIFGFSMDYEVFLLSRIKEYHDITHDNKKSIIFGIEKSGRIITSAALVVIVLCASFLVADVLMIKAFGLGIAVAIFVDAFLIRTILVPATMTLVKSLNWYLPKWLDKIIPKL